MRRNRLIFAVLTVIAILIATSMNSILLLAEDNGLTVTIGDVVGNPGEDVEIPITFKNVPDSGIANCDFILSYNPDVLEIKSIKAGKIIFKPSSFESNVDEKENEIIFLFSEDSGEGTESIFEDGVFAVIYAKIKSDVPNGNSSIKIVKLGSFADKDLKRITSPQVVEGEVEVVGGSEATPKGSSDVGPGTDPAETPVQTSSETTTSTPTPTATAQPTSSPEASNNIHYAYLSGYPGGLFKPENNITRAEAAVIFAKLSGATPDTASSNNSTSFTDISETHWATWAIKYVASEGLFSGYTDGSFMPDKVITRAEFATVVTKYLKKHGMLEGKTYNVSSLKDIDGHWAKENIETLVGEGYIKGYPDDTFRPNASIKRAESVALINRALKRGPLYDATLDFVDVPANHWAYKDIAEGVITHKYEIDVNGNEVLLEKLN